MDKREGTEQNLYQKDLQRELAENRQYKDYIEENGARFRVPYHIVREVIFTDLNKEELIDLEHAARLQYRLMLQDSILFAKVEFVGRKITLTYNPEGAENRKEKIGLQQIIDFLAKEGVHADPRAMQEKEVDYHEVYGYHFNPKTIREHPPYGYTLEEWKKMRDEYERQKLEHEKEKREKFHAWQQRYLRLHPELAAELGVKIEEEKPTLLGRIFKKKSETKEKGFWFHGV